jgi:hypothetical protein
MIACSNFYGLNSTIVKLWWKNLQNEKTQRCVCQFFKRVKFSLTFIDSDSEEFPRLRTLWRRVPVGTRSLKTKTFCANSWFWILTFVKEQTLSGPWTISLRHHQWLQVVIFVGLNSTLVNRGGKNLQNEKN